MRRIGCSLLVVLTLLSVSLAPAAAAEAYSYPEPEVLQIDLVMQPYRYLKMIHSMEKQKQEAVVCINGNEPQKVGIQIRGDRSLKEGMESPVKRLPLELCFDYIDPDGTFRGNPSLKLINCLTPARLLTQLVAMQTFAFLGIPTPRVTPAFVRINDTDFGVYLAVEDIDEAFAREHFGGASLYRPITSRQDPDDQMNFNFGLTQMTTKVDCGSDTIDRYIEASTRGDDVESFFDVDEFLRFMACETFILNEDGFIFNDRNFYLADDHGKLKLLPWDKDDVFSMFEDLQGYAEYERRCNATFQSLTKSGERFALYRQYIRQLNDEFLDPDTFLPWLEAYINLLAPYYQRDVSVSMPADALIAELTTGNELFNTMNGNLLLTFKVYHEQADAMLSGKTDDFSVPAGMTVLSDASDADGSTAGGRSIIFRICAGYWRLRRQAIFGSSSIWIGLFFSAVFLITLVCVHPPTRQRRRKNHTTGGTTTT